MAKTSSSIPGKAAMQHEAGDTWCRTFTLNYITKNDNDEVVSRTPYDLTGYTIRIVVSEVEDGPSVAELTTSAGLVTSDLVNGQIKTQWETQGILLPNKVYYYKLILTSPTGITRTRIEDKFSTK